MLLLLTLNKLREMILYFCCWFWTVISQRVNKVAPLIAAQIWSYERQSKDNKDNVVLGV